MPVTGVGLKRKRNIMDDGGNNSKVGDRSRQLQELCDNSVDVFLTSQFPISFPPDLKQPLKVIISKIVIRENSTNKRFDMPTYKSTYKDHNNIHFVFEIKFVEMYAQANVSNDSTHGNHAPGGLVATFSLLVGVKIGPASKPHDRTSGYTNILKLELNMTGLSTMSFLLKNAEGQNKELEKLLRGNYSTAMTGVRMGVARLFQTALYVMTGSVCVCVFTQFATFLFFSMN